jgi:ERCC4-type nuclease
MPRGKDTKVWNEDLVTALRSREEQCRQRFLQRQYLWRDGAVAIASIRKDIFRYKTGKIVGLPRTLTKCVEEECRSIIEGNRPLLPEGYIPTTLEEKMMSKGFDATQRPNPYHDDPYLKRIKMKGGAYAILMAFHFSETKTMTQNQICKAAQNFCDEEMEPNYYSGRSYGAWSSKKTLVKHGLINESRTTQMGRQGIVRNGVFEYTVTENGTLFVEALLQKFQQVGAERESSQTQCKNKNSSTPWIKSEYTTKQQLSTKPLNAKSENTCNIRKSLMGNNNVVSNLSKTKTNKLIEKHILFSDSEDDDDLFFHRLSNLSKTKMNKQVTENHLSLSDSEDDDNLSSQRRDELLNYKQQYQLDQTKVPGNVSNVIDLVDSSDDESSFSEVDETNHPTKTNIIADSLLISCDNVPQNDRPLMITKSSIASPKLLILIDNRERDHNATPRHMRFELSRHLSKASGSLRQVWPSNLPVGEVEEDHLNYGDFAFVLKRKISSGSQRLPLTIERKRISDLVQRSSRAHHWQQLHRMRDCCEHAILLIEGNTKKTSNFISYDNVESTESWNPDHHTIDDEHAFYRFLGRAILSSPVLKIVQAKDEQASYRSIGAIGLVASLMLWKKDAPKSVPSTKATLNKLYCKLKSRGIPWQIARRISEELGSIQQLNKIYERCEASARPFVLVPAIREACSSMIETENSRSLLEYGTVEGWSSAIHSAWYSRINDPTEANFPYEDNKYFANDRAELLKALHRGKTVERAVQESNIVDEANLRDTKSSIRRVRIESSSTFLAIFPSDVDTEIFYEIISVEENPLGLTLPSVVMQTNDGAFESNKLAVCIIEGNDLFRQIQDSAKRQLSENFMERSKAVAKQVHLEFSSFLICPKNDRRVLLIRGLGAAMNGSAKQANYRGESKVLVDLVFAELMLRYNIVVIQVPCLVNDLEMILREFAMACFYYQLTTRKLR